MCRIHSLASIANMAKLNLSKKTWITSLASLVAVALTTVGIVIAVNQPITVNRPKIFTSKNVGMQMFGWNWNSLAGECSTALGPNGVDWILVDPPQDHMRGTQWWIHYQPTDYSIVSDHGTRAEFKNMVASCKKAGVAVVADAVLNHMASGAYLSFNNQKYGTDLKFGKLYTKANFHEGLSDSDPHFCGGDISDWDAFDERTNCRFPGLPDLATEQEYVRQTEANYLNDLMSLGVVGFRFDAAKHMQPQDIAAIYNKLKKPAYLVQEVPGDADINAEYIPNGDVWAWESASDLSSMFAYASKMDTEAVGWSSMLAEAYPSKYSLYLLSQPFGKPMLYSGYRFENIDQGVAQNPDGTIQDAVCGLKLGEFTCFQRKTSIAGMIAWHHELDGKKITVENGAGGIYSVSRGKTGTFILNFNKVNTKAEIATDLPSGTYCDFVTGGAATVSASKTSCVGDAITVLDGKISMTLKGLSAVAISLSSKLN
jgi:alpha-amylase